MWTLLRAMLIIGCLHKLLSIFARRRWRKSVPMQWRRQCQLYKRLSPLDLFLERSQSRGRQWTLRRDLLLVLLFLAEVWITLVVLNNTAHYIVNSDECEMMQGLVHTLTWDIWVLWTSKLIRQISLLSFHHQCPTMLRTIAVYVSVCVLWGYRLRESAIHFQQAIPVPAACTPLLSPLRSPD